MPLALLTHHPLRLAALALDRQLCRKPGGWWLALEAAEIKTRRALQVPLAADLAAQLERYLVHWRPRIASTR